MIFIFLTLWVFVLAFIPSNNKTLKTVYCSLAGIAFAFISGFRNYTVGSDTPGYVRGFTNSPPLTWESFTKLFGNKEPLYFTLIGFLKNYTDNYTVLMVIVAAFYITAVCYFIKKYSSMPLISYILFMSMGYFSFSMAGIRQTIAIGFMIFAMDKLINKKYISSIILILIATGFHITSLIFFLIFFAYLMPLNILYILISAIASGFLLVGGMNIIKPIVDFVWGESRSYDDEYGGTSTLILLIVVIVAALIFNKGMFSYHKTRKVEKDRNLEINCFFEKMLLLSVPFQVMAIYQANAFRIAMLFHFSIVALIPNTLSSQKNRYVKYGGSIIVIMALLYQLFVITYHTADIIPYSFEWNSII